jgi:hypothetical protein
MDESGVEECLKLIQRAKSNSLRKAEGVLGKGDERFFIMLRWSRVKWDGYETVDVVQIEWYPSYIGEKGLEEKRRRSGAYLWDSLEEASRRVERILRVECISEQKFIDMLVNERHYRPQSDVTNSLLCVR